MLGLAVAMALAGSHSECFPPQGPGLRVPTLPSDNLCLPVFYAVFMVSNLNPFNDNHREGAGSAGEAEQNLSAAGWGCAQCSRCPATADIRQGYLPSLSGRAGISETLERAELTQSSAIKQATSETEHRKAHTVRGWELWGSKQ